ncbi:MAG: hypothetical protein ABS68_08610 [Niastella sp. SCN 39-18]|nr:MAG: hypothetical protein ABS68_08610 [Niastella sp. SCN 39-18]
MDISIFLSIAKLEFLVYPLLYTFNSHIIIINLINNHRFSAHFFFKYTQLLLKFTVGIFLSLFYFFCVS